MIRYAISAILMKLAFKTMPESLFKKALIQQHNKVVNAFEDVEMIKC